MAVTTTLPPPRVARSVPAALGAATVLTQVAYPLVTQGPPRHRLTVAAVTLFFLASVTHAWLWRGPRFAAALVTVAGGGGLVVEAVSVATGVPFGAYAYTATLGWQVLGVPVVIPLAWTMMAYPALVVAERIRPALPWGPVIAGWALASWDLFLDPQMVDAGHWEWSETQGPALAGVPVTNYVAWFGVATAMMAVLWRVPRAAGTDDRLPYGLYLWTFGSSVLAHAAFFGLPGSALVGGVGMGLVVAAFVAAVRRRS